MKFGGICSALTAAAASTWISVHPAAAQSGGISIYQEINNNVVQNILQNVRDQLRRQGAVPPSSGRLGFAATGSDFDNRDPFAFRGAEDARQALAYAKAPSTIPDVVSGWLYGGNLIGGIDRSITAGTVTDTSSVTGAFDVTKIGIFTVDDALTFIGTGGGSWSYQGGLLTVDTSAPSTSITVSYLRGGLSADLTSFVGWTRSTLSAPGFLPAVIEGNSLGSTGNVQYRFDFPFSVFIEPGIGMTYSEGYTKNFGTKISDTTEVHGGARFGTQMKWMDYIIQPSLSLFAYQITDSSALGAVGPVIPSSAIGYRGSGKIAVIWSPSFSSYFEVHAIGQTGGPSIPIAGYSPTQTTGFQGGIRYTWN
ncbi:hypothetical protein ABIC03_006616 [Bradyrhizobium sp. RT6a]|uniref:hypothetical protein n=1 Tax=Bradyrhizobium sp. RT6a TaxID=3156381 RepID=UPI0033972970